MNFLLVLPGNSLKNKEWGEACVEHYSSWFDKVHMQYYDHWQDGSSETNIEAELEKLKNITLPEDVNLFVFAKSIGSLLALVAIQKNIINPNKCVFFGMPLELASQDLFKNDWSALEKFNLNSIAFHNDEDPISYRYTKDAIAKYAPNSIKLITKVGNNHNYTEFDDYDSEIKEYLS